MATIRTVQGAICQGDYAVCLTLLDISLGHMALGPNRVIFQLRFGSKQCRPHQNISVITLDQVQDALLCPMAHIKAYVDKREPIRTSNSLFMMLTPTHKQASLASLRTWLLRIPREAGVSFPAGSTHVAAASFTLAHRISMGTILTCADWDRAKTMFTQ